MTFYEREIERIKREHGLCEDQGVQAHRILRDERHHRSMRVRARVVDVSDETLFPEITAACEWVRSRRTANDG